MSNEEKRPTEAIEYLRDRLDDTDGGFLSDVEVGRHALREALDYIDALEAKDKIEDSFAVGDQVVIIRDNSGIFSWMVGLGGKIVQIDDTNRDSPVLIEFPSKLKARTHYTEIRKV